MLIHTVQRPFNCMFVLRHVKPRILKSHMYTHTHEEAFTCNFCNKNFANKYNLP